jgi:lipid-A-disaccharide synthase-like uncharacterized protein
MLDSILDKFMNLGSIGAGIFFYSWLYQAWETKREGKSIVSPAFWVMRFIGVAILTIYSFQIGSLVFGVTYIITGLITIYNIYIGLKQKV